MTLWDEELAKAIFFPPPCLPGRLSSEFSSLPIPMENEARGPPRPHQGTVAGSNTLSCSTKWLHSNVVPWSLCYIVIWPLLSRCHPVGKGTQDRSSRRLFCSGFFVYERYKLSDVKVGCVPWPEDRPYRYTAHPCTVPCGWFQGPRTELCSHAEAIQPVQPA